MAVVYLCNILLLPVEQLVECSKQRVSSNRIIIAYKPGQSWLLVANSQTL